MEANFIAVLAALPYVLVPVVTALRVRTSRHLDDESGDAPPDAPLPEGWFGKQWACRTGAEASAGPIILFADADTVHSSDLITRSVNAMRRREADLFTVAGKQEIVTFWEKLVQPQIFELMAIRFGGSEAMTRSRSVDSRIANGQCIFVRRDVYDEMGGHSLVKSHVADDMMMARHFFAAGKSVVAMLGLSQLSTRMYRSLRELIEGWGKNVFAAGIDSAPLGALGRLFFSGDAARGPSAQGRPGPGPCRGDFRQRSCATRGLGSNRSGVPARLVALHLHRDRRVAGICAAYAARCRSGFLDLPAGCPQGKTRVVEGSRIHVGGLREDSAA